jgi:transcriptional regulator with XRE-family HTH domain
MKGKTEFSPEQLVAAISADGRPHNEIARQAGISAATLSLIINGRHSRPQVQTLHRLRSVLKGGVQ